MANPKLKKVSVQIKYWSDDGYKSDMLIKAGEGHTNLKTGEPIPPEQGLLDGLDECLRLLILFNFGANADAVIEDVNRRMAAWRAKHSTPTGEPHEQ